MMAFVNELSCECTKNELDLFALPPTHTSIQQANWVEYQPLSILGNAPIKFDVTGTGKDYLDMSNVMLYVRARVTTNADADIGADSTAAAVKLLLHSMFTQVDVSLNATLISSSTNTYP